jgi:predicted nucleic acid-binding Zn ribbon protein
MPPGEPPLSDTTSPDDSTASADTGRGNRQRERVRETITMALYISLSLLAVMVALSGEGGEMDSVNLALAVFMAGIGLLLAHWVAARLSTRIVGGAEEQFAVLAAQLAGGISVTIAAVIPILVLGSDTGRITSELLLLGLVVLAGYRATRVAGLSRARAAVYLASTVAVALGVILFKAFLAH